HLVTEVQTCALPIFDDPARRGYGSAAVHVERTGGRRVQGVDTVGAGLRAGDRERAHGRALEAENAHEQCGPRLADDGLDEPGIARVVAAVRRVLDPDVGS